MTSVIIGVDTTTGLDGPDISHPMSPEGGHLAICGPADLRAAFREHFVGAVEALGGFSIYRGASDAEHLVKALRERSWQQRRPSLLVPPPDLDYPGQEYVTALKKTARGSGVTVLTEHINYSRHYVDIANSYTTVLLGPESGQWVGDVPGAHWVQRSYTQEYVSQNGTTRPVVLG